MNIFYSPGVSSGFHTLTENESKHAAQVLRMKKGDRAIVLDGTGGKHTVEILDPHPRKCEVAVIESEFTKLRNFFLHIAIAPTKMNERMEWFLEKATEIGIDEITPLICMRSERRQTNHERFEKVIVAAMKQSMNPWKPVLNEQCDFDDFLKKCKPGFMAHCMETEKLLLKNFDKSIDHFDIMIGPEGDFTEKEVQQATQAGWISVSLGNSRLRTETAGVVACHTVNLLKA